MKTLIILGSASLLFLSCAANSAQAEVNAPSADTEQAAPKSGLVKRYVKNQATGKGIGDKVTTQGGRTIEKTGKSSMSVQGSRGETEVNFQGGKVQKATFTRNNPAPSSDDSTDKKLRLLDR